MKNVTAIFRTQAIAERVRDEIVTLGVPEADVLIVSGTTPGTHATDALSGFGVPDADVASYRDAVDGGACVVSARLHGEHVQAVEGIMRDPANAGDEEALRAEHPEDQLIAPAGRPIGAVGSTSTIGAADDGRQTYADPMKPRD